MQATLTHRPGKFVWHELYSHDPARAKAFYGAVFGWTATEVPMGGYTYTLFKSGETQVGGMMDLAAMGDPIPPHWAVYVSVPDVDAAAAQAIVAGGRVLGDCHDIPNVGRFAVVQDPQGAHFQLFKAEAGDPPDGETVPGTFCWETLNTTDRAAAVAFYHRVVGWVPTAVGEGEETVVLLTRNGAEDPIPAALVAEVAPGVVPHWLTYVAVADLAGAIAACRAAGGKAFVPPSAGGKPFAVFEDPDGAMVCAIQGA